MELIADDFPCRAARRLSGDVIAAKLKAAFDEAIEDGVVNVLGAPPIEGLGTAGGFKIVIEDRGDSTLSALQTVGQNIVDEANATEGLAGVVTSFRGPPPWLFFLIQPPAAQSLG